MIPLSGIGILGTMITEKYQVNHERTFLEIDSNKLSEREIREKTKEINDIENNVKRQKLFMFGIAGIGLISGIMLLRNKKKILKNTLHNTV